MVCLFGLLLKKANKVVECLNNIFQVGIAHLHYKCDVIVNLFIMQNRHPDAKVMPVGVFVKPLCEKACTHSLTVVAGLALV